jgi:3-methylfumaryl-CoA hydratase
MSELANALAGWAPEPRRRTDRVTSWAVEAFAAVLDQPSPLVGRPGVLPPMWHWFGFLEHPSQRELGADGHPADGGFLPPIPRRRRMFAGGRARLLAPLPVDREIDCRASVASVRVTTGRGGEVAFVTVRHEFRVGGELAVSEEQDIAYRSGSPGQTRRAGRRSDDQRAEGPSDDQRAEGPSDDQRAEGPSDDQRAERPSDDQRAERPSDDHPVAEHELSLDPDATLLFRFSALTYNTHRIHYDHPYATGVESYPGLVVHGPLLALLGLELPRRYRPDHQVTELDYRLRRPAFAGTPLRAWSGPVGPDGRIALAAGAVGAPPSLTGSARLHAMGENGES